ncbi:tRNA (adenosine(37)-N6)-dimethylallyltransferase MiaA [Bombella sp. ESL0385]|uniref:tRNA (adenosine(37)-N6)-dimethylallyltransferase MiaA n=1 Tax=Bombella sp. ESL0385 TaxID=2676446 RepID=UPI0012D8C7D2|nr:tRNA (adenosine(37)-N6)-dimethylallyltransferase MiaA [Bombella sp. ESL0385]MUG89326.1 tRNA (adenosine(37)-N6)-dimethylallyltransferase MiaA [Bombella sp. ESL0385]
MSSSENALIVAGPTCSGKSALAFHLADLYCGTVINADSMQVYRELRILTARPSEAEEEAIPHRLYGVLPAATAGSVAWWRKQALAIMAECRAAGRLPILCGGTGMYLRALTDGLVEVPDPGAEARQQARALLMEIGPEALHEKLMKADPQTASHLHPQDSQRVSRAWEVLMGTGRGLASWRAAEGLPAAPYRFISLMLDPPRDELRSAIAQRFDAMLEAGAMEEVAALRRQNLPESLPAMRAHGVPELGQVLEEQWSLDEARLQATRAIGRYTRRQATWFRHHALSKDGDGEIIFHRTSGKEFFSSKKMREIEYFISSRIDGAGLER